MSTEVDWCPCAVCGQRIGWINCPTGGWWAHEIHPEDEHDAMTPDTAGVQRPEPLTEAELANYAEWAGVYSRGQTGAEQRYSAHVPRLIADLRASRQLAEENARLAGSLHGGREEAVAALRAKDEELQRLRMALDFYANPEHWEATLVHEAPADGPNPGASVWESGAAIDGGERARRALNVPLP